MQKFIYCIIIASLLWSCSPTRIVKPLPKKQSQVSFNLGGPLIGFAGTTIPIPLSSVSGAYGIDSSMTLEAGIHTTSLAFGVIQTDIGLLRSISEQKGIIPGISATPIVNLMTDTWEGNFRFYPQFDINFYWNYLQKKNYFYTGLNNWFELNTVKAHGEKQKNHWIPAFFFGHTFERTKMSYNIEIKYLAPFSSNKDIVVEYKSPGDKGALGIYFGIARKF